MRWSVEVRCSPANRHWCGCIGAGARRRSSLAAGPRRARRRDFGQSRGQARHAGMHGGALLPSHRVETEKSDLEAPGSKAQGMPRRARRRSACHAGLEGAGGAAPGSEVFGVPRRSRRLWGCRTGLGGAGRAAPSSEAHRLGGAKSATPGSKALGMPCWARRHWGCHARLGGVELDAASSGRYLGGAELCGGRKGPSGRSHHRSPLTVGACMAQTHEFGWGERSRNLFGPKQARDELLHRG